MTSMATAGFATLFVMALLIGGMYGALIPTELTVTIRNSCPSSRSVHVALYRGDESQKVWQFSLNSGQTKVLTQNLDIGDYNVTVSDEELGNASATFNIPFKVLSKKHAEAFDISNGTVRHLA